ncbi:MAG: DUF481 domain-containing protein [Endomicrobium sp.]|jgi:opacity protein-like surface antigen|nr:DUF481 domain-containing protein [Endomicrobium sp.]
MKKSFIFLFCIFACASGAFAQDVSQSKWKTSGILSAAYNQTAVSDNWTGKEAFSRDWQLKLSLSVERDDERTNWRISYKEEYGETGTKNGNSVNLDLIEFNTVFTYKIYEALKPYASFYALSQNNKFWDPVTYIESAGLSFDILKNAINVLNVRAGFALKQVNNTITGNSRAAGAEAIMAYSLLFHESAKFTSEARFYETFEESEGETLKWENKLFLKTGKYLTTEIGYTVYYDSSRIPAHSWPGDIETLTYFALGFSFNIFQ